MRVQRPSHLAFWPDETLPTSIGDRYIPQCFACSSEDPDGRLLDLVPDEGYRKTFLRMTRNLAPTGNTFGRVETRGNLALDEPPVVLLPLARETINRSLRQRELQTDTHSIVQIHGVLRVVDLNRDWIEVKSPEGSIKVTHMGDVVDDIIGPFVNHQIIVEAVRGRGKQLQFKDIQLDK